MLSRGPRFCLFVKFCHALTQIAIILLQRFTGGSSVQLWTIQHVLNGLVTLSPSPFDKLNTAMARRRLIFPEDILHLIAEKLDCLGSISEMAAVCKTWNKIATRYLYREIVVTGEDAFRGVFHTLRQHPDRLKLVQTLTIAYLEFEKFPEIYSLLTMCPNLRGIRLGNSELETDDDVAEEGVLTLYIDEDWRADLVSCAAQYCGHKFREFRLIDSRSARGYDSSWGDFDWSKLWTCLNNLEKVYLSLYCYIPLPVSLPSTVRSFEITYAGRNIQPAISLFHNLPPSVLKFDVTQWSWPPSLPRWTEPASGRSITYDIDLDDLAYLKDVQNNWDQNAVQLWEQELEVYRGGGSIRLLFNSYPVTDDVCPAGFKALRNSLDAFGRCLRRSQEMGLFEDTDALIRVGDDWVKLDAMTEAQWDRLFLCQLEGCPCGNQGGGV